MQNYKSHLEGTMEEGFSNIKNRFTQLELMLQSKDQLIDIYASKLRIS